jgi:hypothetical protein
LAFMAGESGESEKVFKTNWPEVNRRQMRNCGTREAPGASSCLIATVRTCRPSLVDFAQRFVMAAFGCKAERGLHFATSNHLMGEATIWFL